MTTCEEEQSDEHFNDKKFESVVQDHCQVCIMNIYGVMWVILDLKNKLFSIFEGKQRERWIEL